MNDVIVPEEFQAFQWASQWVYLGFQLKQTSSALKNVAHAMRSIYLTFGHWGVLAALDISNIHTLKVNLQYDFFTKLFYSNEGCCFCSEPSESAVSILV
jgi:hypothetical protein